MIKYLVNLHSHSTVPCGYLVTTKLRSGELNRSNLPYCSKDIYNSRDYIGSDLPLLPTALIHGASKVKAHMRSHQLYEIPFLKIYRYPNILLIEIKILK